MTTDPTLNAKEKSLTRSGASDRPLLPERTATSVSQIFESTLTTPKQHCVLFPTHTKEELIPVIQKVSAALGAKDFGQARKIMINPQLPFYFKSDFPSNSNRNYQNNNQWKKKNDFNRNPSPNKRNQDFSSAKKQLAELLRQNLKQQMMF
eukprot:GHVP01059893.1.p1 GENE.GHVP01059893.1~~GHVP01059893.1.p1  ORF type:complete len:150 (-),score=27.79 GHVP01059893.1:878-1327(-)